METARIATVFISHIWNDPYQTYADLVVMLNTVPGFHWQNVSISESQAIQIWQEGEHAQRQKLELHGKVAADIIARLNKCYLRLAELDDLLGLEAKIASHNDRLEKELERLRVSHAGERLIKAEAHFAAQELLDAKKKLESISITEVAAERKETFEFVVELERERSFQQECIEKIRASQEQQSWSEEPDVDELTNEYRSLALRFSGKVPRGTIQRMNANLALALYNRIAGCDVLLVLAEMFAQYRRWTEFEFETAWNLRKPIVAVLPPGQDEFPREVVRRCNKAVRWNGAEIAAVIVQAISVSTLQKNNGVA